MRMTSYSCASWNFRNMNVIIRLSAYSGRDVISSDHYQISGKKASNGSKRTFVRKWIQGRYYLKYLGAQCKRQTDGCCGYCKKRVNVVTSVRGDGA